jgi:Flp pilus assembly protein TadG
MMIETAMPNALTPPLSGPDSGPGFGLLRRVRRLARNRRGFAAVEFALLLPVIVLMWCGIVEVSNLVMASSKLAAANQDMADLVSRCTTVSSTDTTAVFNLAALVMKPYPVTATNSTGYIASVNFAPTTGTPTYAWCDSFAGATSTGTTNCPSTTTLQNSATGLGDAGTSVLITGITYKYQPYFSVIYSSIITMTKVTYIHPRLVTLVTHSASGSAVCTLSL